MILSVKKEPSKGINFFNEVFGSLLRATTRLPLKMKWAKPSAVDGHGPCG